MDILQIGDSARSTPEQLKSDVYELVVDMTLDKWEKWKLESHKPQKPQPQRSDQGKRALHKIDTTTISQPSAGDRSPRTPRSDMNAGEGSSISPFQQLRRKMSQPFTGDRSPRTPMSRPDSPTTPQKDTKISEEKEASIKKTWRKLAEEGAKTKNEKFIWATQSVREQVKNFKPTEGENWEDFKEKMINSIKEMAHLSDKFIKDTIDIEGWRKICTSNPGELSSKQKNILNMHNIRQEGINSYRNELP